jgi:hydrogenase maturation factor
MGCSEDHCITCSDAAVPMRVRRVDRASGLAECVGDDGVAGEVDLTLVDGAGEGDTVLVHAGVALAHGRPDGAVEDLAGADAPPGWRRSDLAGPDAPRR